MEVRTAASPKDVKHYTTERLREEFLIQNLFQADEIKLVYSHIDRIITGAAVPVKQTLELKAGDELRAEYFLQRRELGLINIGGDGVITVDGKTYEVCAREGMYIGRGSKNITFASKDASNPAKFYMNSAPAHTTYPTVHTLSPKVRHSPVLSSSRTKTRSRPAAWKIATIESSISIS